MSVYGATLIRFACGFILLSAAIAKSRDLPGFARVLQGYRILPASLTLPISVLVVVAELVTGLALFTVSWQAPGVAGAAVLFGVFAAVASRPLVAGDKGLECGCLGKSIRLGLSWVTVAANTALVVALIGALTTRTGTRIEMTEGALLAAVGMLLAVTYWLLLYGASVLRLVEDAISAKPTTRRRVSDDRA
jgi:hypothetical protein